MPQDVPTVGSDVATNGYLSPVEFENAAKNYCECVLKSAVTPQYAVDGGQKNRLTRLYNLLETLTHHPHRLIS